MSNDSPKDWGPYTVQLDDNGNVKGSVHEVNGVSPGDTVTYVLKPSRSADWCFAGYNSSVEGAVTGFERPTAKSLTLTMGVGYSEEKINVTLLYYLDISGASIASGAPLDNNWPTLIVKSNDPVIKFR